MIGKGSDPGAPKVRYLWKLGVLSWIKQWFGNALPKSVSIPLSGGECFAKLHPLSDVPPHSSGVPKISASFYALWATK